MSTFKCGPYKFYPYLTGIKNHPDLMLSNVQYAMKYYGDCSKITAIEDGEDCHFILIETDSAGECMAKLRGGPTYDYIKRYEIL